MSNDNAEDSKKLVRGQSLVDATTIVVGSMIGSGIFIVSAESSRLVGSPGWLLVAWILAGVMTLCGALCLGEVAAMMPQAGGPYVFLSEAYSPGVGFLFGWSRLNSVCVKLTVVLPAVHVTSSTRIIGIPG